MGASLHTPRGSLPRACRRLRTTAASTEALLARPRPKIFGSSSAMRRCKDAAAASWSASPAHGSPTSIASHPASTARSLFALTLANSRPCLRWAALTASRSCSVLPSRSCIASSKSRTRCCKASHLAVKPQRSTCKAFSNFAVGSLLGSCAAKRWRAASTSRSSSGRLASRRSKRCRAVSAVASALARCCAKAMPVRSKSLSLASNFARSRICAALALSKSPRRSRVDSRGGAASARRSTPSTRRLNSWKRPSNAARDSSEAACAWRNSPQTRPKRSHVAPKVAVFSASTARTRAACSADATRRRSSASCASASAAPAPRSVRKRSQSTCNFVMLCNCSIHMAAFFSTLPTRSAQTASCPSSTACRCPKRAADSTGSPSAAANLASNASKRGSMRSASASTAAPAAAAARWASEAHASQRSKPPPCAASNLAKRSKTLSMSCAVADVVAASFSIVT
mmetsp:Transcript_43520/g.125793  ORF Transcript_43520/g.125793 Transcript_43520/m.125793 type:complete len:456 (-) Transcript_43520:1026-2393(-)